MGTISKRVFINVVESTKDNTTIEFSKDFCKTGESVAAKMSVDGFTEFVNYQPTWAVKIENGDALDNVEFLQKDNGSIVIKNAQKGFYHFYISGDSISNTEVAKRVQDVDVASLAKQMLPYVALVMLIGVVVAIIIKQNLNHTRTLGGSLKKISATLSKNLTSSIDGKKFVGLIKLTENKLMRCYDKALEEDLKTLGQYQIVCNLLLNSINICKASIKSYKSLDREQCRMIIESLCNKYINVAELTSNELDLAISRYSSAKVNAVTVEPEKPRTHDNKKVSYLEMLTNFYKNGDIEDSNNRSGDEDRNSDTKTEC